MALPLTRLPAIRGMLRKQLVMYLHYILLLTAKHTLILMCRDLALSITIGFSLATVYWEYYSVPRLAVFRDHFAAVKVEYEDGLKLAASASKEEEEE